MEVFVIQVPSYRDEVCFVECLSDVVVHPSMISVAHGDSLIDQVPKLRRLNLELFTNNTSWWFKAIDPCILKIPIADLLKVLYFPLMVSWNIL